MAKKTVATLQTSQKNMVKVIKMKKSEKTNNYYFKEEVVPSDEVKAFFEKA